jgi:hypothetical protein
MKELNVSHEISDLVTTVFLLGYVFGVSFKNSWSLSNSCSSLYSGVGLPKFSSVQFSPTFQELRTELAEICQNWTENWTEPQEPILSVQFCSVRSSDWRTANFRELFRLYINRYIQCIYSSTTYNWGITRYGDHGRDQHRHWNLVIS